VPQHCVTGHGSASIKSSFWYRELYRDQLRDFSKPEPLSRVFPLGLLAPHPTCLLVGCRAGCGSPHFLYHTLFSTDLAISGHLPRFCAAFSP
jgi:hypothetical protein